MSLFTLLLGLGPSIVWMYWIWRKDKFHREPMSLVLLLFIVGGILSVVTTLVVVGLYDSLVPTEQESPILNMLFTAALPEELFKFLPVLLFAWRSKHWDEPFDGIVYAGATALGFNLIETVGYMLGEESVGGTIYQGIVRGTVGGHMVYGIIMGFFLSRARFSQGGARWRNLLLAIAVPMTLHLSWNAALTYGGDIIDGFELGGLLAWVLSTALWVLAFEYMRKSRDASPFSPQAWTVQVAPTGCWHCGNAYPAQSNFCHVCGAQVAPAAPTVQQ